MLIEELLEKLVADGGSDLHISSGLPPAARIDGKLKRYDYPPLSPDDVETLLFPMLSNEQRRTLEQNWELDFSYGIEGLSRSGLTSIKIKATMQLHSEQLLQLFLHLINSVYLKLSEKQLINRVDWFL